MKLPFLRPLSVLGTLAVVPGLFGATGGCQSDGQTSTDAADETIKSNGQTGADAADGTIRCVETVKCPSNVAWDAVHCQCALPAQDAGSDACIPALCIQGDAWDPVVCRCVPNVTEGGSESAAAPTDAAPAPDVAPSDSSTCISSEGGCMQGDVWDPVLCRCVPKATDGGGCQSAQDCNGALPQICVVCVADGGMACAHWVCSGGQCQTAICE